MRYPDSKPAVKLFMDGANIDDMRFAYQQGRVQGFTTNPTLMRKAGIMDYERFARDCIAAIPDMPISFEVFSDGFSEMEREARTIASWGGRTYVKVPITNTMGESTLPLVRRLAADGIAVNVTAILTMDQIQSVAKVLDPQVPAIVSVFAGRIADAGVDPEPIMQQAARILLSNPNAELLWASPREVFNLVQAERCGCHILTATPDLLNKISLIGKNLDEYSLETVRMFHHDAREAGFEIA